MSKKRKTQTQSVEFMINNFHGDFESGLSIQQISEKYDIDKSYIYKLLDQIATNNGVTREYYLVHPQKSHSNTACDRNNSYTPYKEEDYKNICKSFDELISDISALRQEVEKLNEEADITNHEEKEN